jgi:peptide/nickel transport system substrate-binding protein
MKRLRISLFSRGESGPRGSSTVLRTGVALVAAAAMTITVAACGGGSSGGGSSSGAAAASDTVTIALDSDAAANGYDPLLYSQGQFQFFSSVYDALFVTTTDGKVEPSLVTAFTNNADNTQLTLTLRDGVTFTDGSTLDATLVKANLDRRSDPDLASYQQFAAGGSAEITDVTATDAKTVVITWAAPQAAGQDYLTDGAGVIIGKSGVENPDSLATTPVGSGPYTLNTGATTKGSTYTFDKNDKAWNVSTFPFNSIAWKIIVDPQARANAVVSGQAAVAVLLGGDTVDLVKSRQSVVDNGGVVAGFPVFDKTGATNPAFGEVDARLALLYGIDRQAIVTDLHPGARPTSQLFPEGVAGYDPALDTEYAYDPDKAKQLLASAGYPDGFSFDMMVLGQPDTDLIAIQKQWQAIGVQMNFVTASSTDAFFAAATTTPLGWAPQLAVGNPLGFVQGVLYGGFMNLQKATNETLAAALGEASAATGAQQEAALKKVNAAITSQAWFLPVYESFVYVGYDASKVATPAFAGTNSYIVLSSIAPAGPA